MVDQLEVAGSRSHIELSAGVRSLEQELNGQLEGVLRRHSEGDWGDLTGSDVEQNRKALGAQEAIVSSYRLARDLVVWVVTTADRSRTVALLPSESFRYSDLVRRVS